MARTKKGKRISVLNDTGTKPPFGDDVVHVCFGLPKPVKGAHWRYVKTLARGLPVYANEREARMDATAANVRARLWAATADDRVRASELEASARDAGRLLEIYLSSLNAEGTGVAMIPGECTDVEFVAPR